MIICFTESQGGCVGIVSSLNSIVIVVSLICSLFNTKDKKQNVTIKKTLDQNTYFIIINFYEQKKGLVSLYLISLVWDLPKKTLRLHGFMRIF
jgi:hypothetical protein